MLDHSHPLTRHLKGVCRGTSAWRARPHFHALPCACGNEWIEFNDGADMTPTERRVLDAVRDARQSGEA